jgi:dTDP-4-dehydrorhamnose reductase
LTEATPKPLAWITGAAGFIGNYLVQTAPQFAPGWRVQGLTRAQVDLLDFDAVRRAFREQQPRLIIHCAAVSRSPVAQANPDLARRVNVDVTAHLAGLAADIPFVFFSSDLVFDGLTGNYDESATPNPLNVYAETKITAEKVVLANPRHTVLRVALNAGVSLTGDRAFNEQMRLAWQRGETLRLFTDEFRCPIPASITARAVWELVNQDQTGIFHVAGSERLSRLEIGKLLAARWPRLNPKIETALARDHPNPPRPRDASLNCAKVQRALPFPLPAFSQWLRDHPDELI